MKYLPPKKKIDLYAQVYKSVSLHGGIICTRLAKLADIPFSEVYETFSEFTDQKPAGVPRDSIWWPEEDKGSRLSALRAAIAAVNEAMVKADPVNWKRYDPLKKIAGYIKMEIDEDEIAKLTKDITAMYTWPVKLINSIEPEEAIQNLQRHVKELQDLLYKERAQTKSFTQQRDEAVDIAKMADIVIDKQKAVIDEQGRTITKRDNIIANTNQAHNAETQRLLTSIEIYWHWFLAVSGVAIVFFGLWLYQLLK